MVKQILQIENTTEADFFFKLNAILNKSLENPKKNAQSNDDEKFISRQETATLFGVSLVTIWQWERKGIISGFRIGNKVLYRKSQLLEALRKINQ